ncbi:MAG: hypothetical protein A2508_01060 [Candidatus Lambdaproteobacteria bacterium RIFOXYD12_FULL_49_8]|uniref:HPr-rel-A system PqqD family protein n=1 Tax=Candidatus Lambdaproteobacteria bacterium RIFOXYD2_FULL_50_16 TaxID=1817772 RepID=A0A1F6GF04_9PROT|nr:MAG: hypothetical protein A2527_03685 [Candidatus Lambdaproteobacteria bacterium RIFOXYD2_FULL_50_16]OGG97443.1 MAG: hypothetical protein A2508_01060 [Candidatus Lambdaproteobacteria bacterium RIFOXYD12_FULL_49_8]
MSHRIKQLAINGEGFLFDPTSGESYTANGSAAMVIRGLQGGKSIEAIKADLAENYEVSTSRIERDLADFLAQLRLNQLL